MMMMTYFVACTAFLWVDDDDIIVIDIVIIDVDDECYSVQQRYKMLFSTNKMSSMSRSQIDPSLLCCLRLFVWYDTMFAACNIEKYKIRSVTETAYIRV